MSLRRVTMVFGRIQVGVGLTIAGSDRRLLVCRGSASVGESGGDVVIRGLVVCPLGAVQSLLGALPGPVDGLAAGRLTASELFASPTEFLGAYGGQLCTRCRVVDAVQGFW